MNAIGMPWFGQKVHTNTHPTATIANRASSTAPTGVLGRFQLTSRKRSQMATPSSAVTPLRTANSANVSNMSAPLATAK